MFKLAAKKGEQTENPQKAFQEALIRYLAPLALGNCENWKFDVVVEVGTMTNTDQFKMQTRTKFKQYLTIDRLTGEIIQEKIENNDY